jgi:hypothetical protein
MKLNSLVALPALFVISAASVAHADVLADWTFESNLSSVVGGTTGITQATLPAIAPETAAAGLTASFTGVHANAGTTTTKWYTGNGNGSAIGLFSNGWAVGDYYEIDANLSSFSDLHLSYDDDGSNTGPNTFKIQISTDGTTFQDLNPPVSFTIPAPGAGNTTINFSTTSANAIFTNSVDLSAYTGVVGIRIVDAATAAVASGSTLGTAGTNRLDNIVITGTPAAVPEPASLSILGASAVLLLRRRSRARS